MSERKVILYIAMSLDGYIADENGSIDFLSLVQQDGEDYGYEAFVSGTDAVIIGRKTFDTVIAMGYKYPHTDKEVYIITRTPRPDNGTFKYYTGNLKKLVTALKSRPGKHIYCDGGAEIVRALLAENLIDEFIISVVPVLLGKGILLFKNDFPKLSLKLMDTKYYDKGLVQLHYIRVATECFS